MSQPDRNSRPHRSAPAAPGRRRIRAPRPRRRRLRPGLARGAKPRLHDLTEAQAAAGRGARDADPCGEYCGPGPARTPGGLHPCAHLRARPGVPQKLEARHRQQGEGRRRARRDRYARSRPAAHAGARRLERRRGQRQARADQRASAGSRSPAPTPSPSKTSTQRTFTWNANIAQVKAAQANVDRLVAEEGFKRLIAPFDGIVTARETDIGALINVGAAGGAELFVVSETGKLRVYVNVPQNYVPSVPPGTKATITRARTSRQNL